MNRLVIPKEARPRQFLLDELTGGNPNTDGRQALFAVSRVATSP